MINTDVELLPKYSKHKPIEVRSIIRVKDADGNEHLVYSAVEYRLDKALNVTHRWRPLIGKYPIPIAEYYIERKDFGKEQRKFREIVNFETGYSIRYSPVAVDKIRDLGVPLDGKVQYMIEHPNGVKIGVTDYDSFRNGKWEELAHFGKIPTEQQHKVWIEREGGPDVDKQRLDERQRIIDERETPQRMPTMHDVKKMIEEAVTEKEVSKEEAQALEKAEIEDEDKPLEEQAVNEVTKSSMSPKKEGRGKRKK